MNTNARHPFAAFTLSAALTLAMLASINVLATSQPPAGLLAQAAQSTATQINT